jgi:phosphonoacetate hydrolase
MTAVPRRVLIVAFDALRPDMVTPALMPNLTAFAAEGVRFTHSRATFPTETRVNQAALVTGCYPARHGIVGNTFLDPIVAPDKLFATGDETQIAELDRRLDGKLVDVPVFGEILATRALQLSVISAGTPGGARMLHHKAEQLGGFRLALHRPDASVPPERIARVLDHFGLTPKHEIPTLAWLTYATNVYLDYIEPEIKPTVCVLWYPEPDNSYHFRGLGTEANLTALRHVDAEFGRIVSWRDQAGLDEELQIITMSDHGQLTITAEAIGIGNALRHAGFTIGNSISDGADAALALASAGGIYVRDSNPKLIQAIVEWLQTQSWCGPLFTREGLYGTLQHSDVGIDHRRAPDIALALRTDDAVNEHGIAGTCLHDTARYPVGGGLHGGLHRFELSTWLAMNGSAFRSGYESSLPAGIVDILPSVLALLDIPVAPNVQGRVLLEAFAKRTQAPAPPVTERVFSAAAVGNYRAHLQVTHVGQTPYLERGWVD